MPKLMQPNRRKKRKVTKLQENTNLQNRPDRCSDVFSCSCNAAACLCDIHSTTPYGYGFCINALNPVAGSYQKVWENVERVHTMAV